MGFWSRLFGGGQETEAQGTAQKSGLPPQVARLVKKIENKYGQPEDRRAAIRQLAEIGTTDAVRGLLRRFTFRIEQTIGDEEEKQMVFEEVVRLGPTSVPALLEFLEKENSPFWPTRALREIVGEEQAVTHLLDIIDRTEAIFDRDIERKVELVSNLRQFRDDRVKERLLAFLQDENEELRVHALEGLAERDAEEMTDVLVERLLDENETQRVKTTVLNLLIDRKWKVKRHKEAIRKVIPATFWIDDVGVIHRR